MSLTPGLLTDLLNSTLSCACECLNTFSDCPCPCRTFISAGPPVWDMEACCSDGQLSVHIDRIYAYENFPSEQGRVKTCIAPLAGDVVVTLLRCYPAVVRDDGTAPTADEIGAASEQAYKDLWVLTNCIICNLASRSKFVQSIFRGSRILPPNGGCIGVEIRFTTEIVDPLPF